MNKNLHQISKYILSGLLIVLSNSSFSYDTATPESQGLSSEVLDSLRPIVEPLVDEGRLPNYLISIYKNEKLF